MAQCHLVFIYLFIFLHRAFFLATRAAISTVPAWSSTLQHPNAFFPLDISYDDQASTPADMLERGTKTKLPKPVVNLVNLLFDVESMKKTLQELEIDMDKMPLGKLSRSHLKEAMSTLTELSGILVGLGGGDLGRGWILRWREWRWRKCGGGNGGGGGERGAGGTWTPKHRGLHAMRHQAVTLALLSSPCVATSVRTPTKAPSAGRFWLQATSSTPLFP